MKARIFKVVGLVAAGGFVLQAVGCGASLATSFTQIFANVFLTGIASALLDAVIGGAAAA